MQDIVQHWEQCRSEPQREIVWRSLTQAHGVWYRACREAAQAASDSASGIRSAIEHMLMQQGGESVLGYCPPGYDAGRQARLLRAWLRAAEVACRSATAPAPELLKRLAEEEGASPALVKELFAPPARILRTVEMVALLVNPADRGVPATLTLELLEHGSGEIYPEAALALCRDIAMLEAENAAVQLAQQRLGARDVRWRLTRLDGVPLGHLGGPSLGAPLAIGLALLLDPPEPLEDIELARVAITAATDAHGRLAPITGLWAKLTPEAAELANLHTIVLAADQGGVPPRYQTTDGELTVIRAGDIETAIGELVEHALPRRALRSYERQRCEYLKFRLPGTRTRTDIHFPLIPLYRQMIAAPLHDLDIEQFVTATNTVGDPVVPEGYAPASMGELLNELAQPSRWLVLGDPGSGKSTLLQGLSWALASSCRQRLPARIRLRDWEQWAVQYPEADVADFLAARLRARISRGAPGAGHWRRWLSRGEALLLLDGLDELANPHGFHRRLTRLLAYTRTPIVITSRTIAFAAHRANLDGFGLLWLGPMSDDQRRDYIQIYPARHGFDRAALNARIAGDPALSALARTPLLLAMLCFVTDTGSGQALPRSRAALYDQLIELLLARPGHVPVHYPAEPPRLIERKAILADTALWLQLRSLYTFAEDDLIAALAAALAQGGYGDTAAQPWANALHKEFLDNSGLVSNRGGSLTQPVYAFTHHTLHEYLTAYALARRIRASGWETALPFDDARRSINRLLHDYKNDERWALTLEFVKELANAPCFGG